MTITPTLSPFDENLSGRGFKDATLTCAALDLDLSPEVQRLPHDVLPQRFDLARLSDVHRR